MDPELHCCLLRTKRQWEYLLWYSAPSWFHVLLLCTPLQANVLMGNPVSRVSLTSLCLPPSVAWIPQRCLPRLPGTLIFAPHPREFSKALIASLYLNSCFLPGLSAPFLMPRMEKCPEKKCNTQEVRLPLMTFPSLQVLVPQVLAAPETRWGLWTDFF